VITRQPQYLGTIRVPLITPPYAGATTYSSHPLMPNTIYPTAPAQSAYIGSNSLAGTNQFGSSVGAKLQGFTKLSRATINLGADPAGPGMGVTSRIVSEPLMMGTHNFLVEYPQVRTPAYDPLASHYIAATYEAKFQRYDNTSFPNNITSISPTIGVGVIGGQFTTYNPPPYGAQMNGAANTLMSVGQRMPWSLGNGSGVVAPGMGATNFPVGITAVFARNATQQNNYVDWPGATFWACMICYDTLNGLPFVMVLPNPMTPYSLYNMRFQGVWPSQNPTEQFTALCGTLGHSAGQPTRPYILQCMGGLEASGFKGVTDWSPSFYGSFANGFPGGFILGVPQSWDFNIVRYAPPYVSPTEFAFIDLDFSADGQLQSLLAYCTDASTAPSAVNSTISSRGFCLHLHNGTDTRDIFLSPHGDWYYDIAWDSYSSGATAVLSVQASTNFSWAVDMFGVFYAYSSVAPYLVNSGAWNFPLIVKDISPILQPLLMPCLPCTPTGFGRQ
jgi:hypothetical protein